MIRPSEITGTSGSRVTRRAVERQVNRSVNVSVHGAESHRRKKEREKFRIAPHLPAYKLEGAQQAFGLPPV